MRSPNRSLNEVNVFVVPTPNPTVAAFGISTETAAGGLDGVSYVEVVDNPDPQTAGKRKRKIAANGLYLFSETPAPAETIAQTIAHEMGHYMNVCRGHSTSDLSQSGSATRDDSVSRRRLMYNYVVLQDSDFKWRNDTGYGTIDFPNVGVRGAAGSFVSHRELANAQDITFGESLRAREARNKADFYAPDQNGL